MIDLTGSVSFLSEIFEKLGGSKMEKKTICFDVGNDFYQDKLEELKQELEKGCSVNVYVDCIGHSRNNYTQEAYKDALVKHYGNKLQVQYNSGVCSYDYTYELK